MMPCLLEKILDICAETKQNKNKMHHTFLAAAAAYKEVRERTRRFARVQEQKKNYLGN